ncbi:PREDICTED: probable cytosolic oligopeptidase A [Polistes dominula]|uniref:Probable cytosolic oligopeptidase A n=1 Tax=Polistes dominula TaxID=743375 RepID=A0ABM1IU74_POLDO|nr:PREDICTED: probable cytosolic oligopeptidase A [Polistes dominula]
MVLSFCVKRFILSKSNILKIPKRNGYIVLLPEIGEECVQQNLLKENKTPEFNNITIEKCIAAIQKQVVECDNKIQKIEKEIQDNKDVNVFNDILLPLEETYVPLGITFGIAQTLYYGNQTLIPTKSFTNINLRTMKAMENKFSSLPIYEACKRIKDNENIQLTSQQERILDKYIIEGKLNGLEFSEKKREWLKNCYNILYQQEMEFTKRYEGATKKYVHVMKDENDVKDFSNELLEATAANPAEPHVGPWTITAEPHILKLFLECCSSRTLRWKLWRINATLLSPLDDKIFHTGHILKEIYSMRKQQAALFKYKSYSHMNMITKMNNNLDEVYNTFDILLDSARNAQILELETLNKFAKEKGLTDSLKPWDILYWNKQFQDSLYEFKKESLKDYFPLPKVLNGLFDLLKVNFALEVVENKNVDIWHKDVSFYDIFNTNISSTEPIASFYLDPYVRGDEKSTNQNLGYVIVIKSRSKCLDTKPMCSLIFNFQRPKDGKPSLLSLENVRVLFQKFGHALHHMTSTTDYADISGLSYVEWDIAYIYDFFLENWLYEPSTLQMISEHHETKDTLPVEAIEVIQNSRLQLAGYNLCTELFFARFDLEVYSSTDSWREIMERLWKEHFIIPMEINDPYIYSFRPMFSTCLSTSYYSRLWSQMIAADIYRAFQEIPIEDKINYEEVCKRFQDTFLSLNSTCSISEIFRRFRGRDPNPRALLKNLKLYKTE